MVIPRSFSSGALSIESKERSSERPFFARTVVIAAVRVVLPWSTCQMVPTFTCGLDLSNFSFSMFEIYLGINCLTIVCCSVFSNRPSFRRLYPAAGPVRCGRRWIRTTEVEDSRFTVCPIWPLWYPPVRRRIAAPGVAPLSCFGPL